MDDMGFYKAAAEAAGWTYHVARMTGTPSFYHPAHGYVIADNWQDLCEQFGIGEEDADDWHEQAQDEMESRAYWHGR
jgi:hypothetical protein